MKPAVTYTYNGTVSRVVDGDTLDIQVDLGFGIWKYAKVRLIGLNAPELSTDKGKASAEILRLMLPVGTRVLVESIKPDKYGDRWNAIVWKGAGSSETVNAALIASGAALPWNGKGVKPT